MKRKQGIQILMAVIFLFLFHSVSADMGSILTSNAKVQEDSQKAIILHNSDEEILILGTDLKANEPANVVRFIPFPSEPTVQLAPKKAFESMAGIVKSHELKKLFYTKGGGPLTKNVEVHFSRKLGVHDITVIKINNASQFREWVNNFFKSKRIPIKKEYPNIEKIVTDYVSRGIQWFVFDYVNVTMETRMIQPVEYRFKSKELYYPLVTSNTFGGSGGIDLFMITPCTPCNLFPDCFNIGLGQMQATTSSELRYDELKNILPDASQFFSNKKIFIQMAQYWGSYQFSNDIFYDLSKGKPHAVWVEEESPGIAYNGFDRFDNSAVDYSWKTYETKDKSFSVRIPEGWQTTVPGKTQNGGTVQLFLKNDDATNIEIERFSDSKETSKQFIDALLNPVLKPPYEDFGQVDTTKVNWQKALKFEVKTQTFTKNGRKETGTDVIQRYVLLPQPEGFYVLRMESPLSIAQKHIVLFDKIVNSFAPNKK